MKGLKKLALATAVAAAPFAQAEMTAMDDAFLGEMTGQAGVTIELDTAITIDSFTYTDTDGTGNGEGSLSMNGIAFGGATVGGSTSFVHDARLDDFKIDIDVDADDGLHIHLGGTDSAASLLGLNPVDFGLHIDTVTSSGLGGNIASDINIAGNLGPIDIKINNNNVDSADLIDVQAYFEVTSGSLDVDVMGMGITNLKIGQDSMPLLSDGGAYQQEARNALATELSDPSLVTADAATLATAIATLRTGSIPTVSTDAATATVATYTDTQVIATARSVVVSQAEAGWVEVGSTGVDADGKTAATLGTEAGTAFDGSSPTRAGTEATAIAGVSATISANLTADAPAQDGTNFAFVALTIGSGAANYSNLTEGDVAVDSALIVNLTDFNIDVSMDITMGETGSVARNLGNIALENLDMSGTVLKIYGH